MFLNCTVLVEEYLTARAEDKIADKTWNMERMVISNLFKFAKSRKWTDDNPVKEVPRKKQTEPHVEHLNEEEAEKLLKKMKEKEYKVPYHEIVATILYTGMRVNEAVHLTKSDVDLERSLISIREKQIAGKIWKPKTREKRFIPVPDELRGIIEQQMNANGELLFPNTNGNLVSDRKVLDRVKECCRKAGIKQIHVHSLRHTFCSMAHMRGIHETAIQAVLGHKSSSMTRRYRHLRPDYLQEQFKGFGYGKTPESRSNSDKLYSHCIDENNKILDEKDLEEKGRE